MKCICKVIIKGTPCGHVWESRSEKPKSCPKCKRYYWEKGNACTCEDKALSCPVHKGVGDEGS